MENQIDQLLEDLRTAIRQSLKTEEIGAVIVALLNTGHEVAIAIDATLYEVPADVGETSVTPSSSTLEFSESDQVLLQGMGIGY